MGAVPSRAFAQANANEPAVPRRQCRMSPRRATDPARRPTHRTPPMLSLLPAALRGAITGILLGLNTLIVTLTWCRRRWPSCCCRPSRCAAICDRLINALASRWVANNDAWIAAVTRRAVGRAGRR